MSAASTGRVRNVGTRVVVPGIGEDVLDGIDQCEYANEELRYLLGQDP